MLVRIWVVLLLAVTGMPLTLAATSPVFLDRLPSFSHADRFFESFEDASGRVTVQALLDNPAVYPFAPGTDAVLNPGYSTSAFWLRARFALDAQAPAAIERYLELDYALLDDVLVVVTHQGQIRQQWQTGDHHPFATRPIPHTTFLFPLHLQPGEEITVYLRIASSSSLRLPLLLWEPFEFHQAQRVNLLVEGVYFGVLLLMLFYNLCLLISVRDVSYFYYIAYTSSLTLFQLAMTGYGFEYGWPNLPQINDALVPLGICLISGFVLKFSQHILALKTQWPSMHQFFNVVVAMMGVGAAASLALTNEQVIKPVILCAILAACLMLFAGAREALKGATTAKWFLLAWSSLLCSSLVLAMVSMGWIPANLLTTNAFMIGTALQLALLSLTLAERHNQINREKKQALEIANRSLQESNRIKDEFLATISHELRTPMNGVLGCLEHIQHERISDRVETYLTHADSSARHMMLLVDSLLTYTELQSGKLALNHRPFAPRELVDIARALFTDIARRKGIALNFYLETSIPEHLHGDMERISQILNNLLDNAIKFTHEGQVEVHIQGEAGDAEGYLLQIAVSDTGIGIPREKRELIFERFRQADGAFQRSYGGLGIGLAINKALLDLMQGNITVQSQEHSGSTFTVRIPCRRAAEAVEGPADTGQAASGQALHILVVEDNPVNQMVLKAMLKKQGYQVSTADNGAQAVEWLKTHVADAVLMDCQMPVMDGFQAARAIRKLDGPNASVPIIAVTANAMSQDRAHCLEAGMNDHTSKPIDAQLLNKKIIYWVNVCQRTSSSFQTSKAGSS